MNETGQELPDEVTETYGQASITEKMGHYYDWRIESAQKKITDLEGKISKLEDAGTGVGSDSKYGRQLQSLRKKVEGWQQKKLAADEQVATFSQQHATFDQATADSVRAEAARENLRVEIQKVLKIHPGLEPGLAYQINRTLGVIEGASNSEDAVEKIKANGRIGQQVREAIIASDGVRTALVSYFREREQE